MRITSLIENTSKSGLPVEHGLSLHIQLENGLNVLFDMGQRCLFAENAERLGISIADVDIAIISHGHYDHGGGLRRFLELNSKAKVYVHQDAFQPHYSLRENGLAYIGLDKDLHDSERIVMCSSITPLADGMLLFADVDGKCCTPHGNRLLFGPEQSLNDNFSHEQNLMIEENGNRILVAGCAHSGIVNIIRKSVEVSGNPPTHVLAGMHLVKSGLEENAENAFITTLATELMAYDKCQYFTMHCTGQEQYQKLKSLMSHRIEYLSCGETIDI